MPDRATLRGRRDRAILEVLARGGLRRSELCALSWDDVVEVPRWPDPRLRDAVADRPADETAWALQVEHSKRGRSRLVPLARPVVAALEAWRATSVSARARSRGSRPRVFVSITRAREQDGAPLAPGAIGKIVARYAAAADLPPALRTPHVLRHTFCTAIAERAGLDVVAELAGHADVRTSKRYVTVTAARTRGAVDQAFGSGTFAGGWGQARRVPAPRRPGHHAQGARAPAARTRLAGARAVTVVPSGPGPDTSENARSRTCALRAARVAPTITLVAATDSQDVSWALTQIERPAGNAPRIRKLAQERSTPVGKAAMWSAWSAACPALRSGDHPLRRRRADRQARHYARALRRRAETRCRVTPKRSAIWSIVRPSAYSARASARRTLAPLMSSAVELSVSSCTISGPSLIATVSAYGAPWERKRRS